MTTFIASDIHLNHLRILQYCPERRLDQPLPEAVEDQWKMVAVMNEKIISNWNEVIGVDDEVYVLGDVAMGLIEKAPALIQRLNGKKYLVKGNHDKTLTKSRDGKSLADDLFVWVKDYHEMFYSYEGKKHNIVMSHFPMSHFNLMNQGGIMLHGHLHGNPSGLTGRIFDVGIDTNNLYPYLMDEVVQRMLQIDVIRDHHND
jgi:calcineurin-like phosphoesterase family protein